MFSKLAVKYCLKLLGAVNNSMYSSPSEDVILWMIVLRRLVDAGDKVGAPGAVEHTVAVDEALRYLATSKFSTLRSLMKNRKLYTVKGREPGDWAEVTKL